MPLHHRLNRAANSARFVTSFGKSKFNMNLKVSIGPRIPRAL